MNPLTKFRYETVKILITGFIVMAVLTAFIAANIIHLSGFVLTGCVTVVTVSFNNRIERICGSEIAHTYLKDVFLIGLLATAIALVIEICSDLPSAVYLVLGIIHNVVVFVFLRLTYTSKIAEQQNAEICLKGERNE